MWHVCERKSAHEGTRATALLARCLVWTRSERVAACARALRYVGGLEEQIKELTAALAVRSSFWNPSR